MTTAANEAMSVLSCALTVAEKVSVPLMLGESNLTWKSDQLTELTRLLARAGRFDRALKLIETVGGPERVIAPAVAEIAIGALRAGDEALIDSSIKRLAAMEEWTAPIALADVAKALQGAGRVDAAFALVTVIEDSAAKSEALLYMVRQSRPAMSKKDASRWLEEAFRTANGIRAGISPFHIDIGGMREYPADFSQRYSVLLDLTGAFAELEMTGSARKAVKAIGEIPDYKSSVWKARALLTMAEAAGRSAEEIELTAEAFDTIEPAAELVLGDTDDKVEILVAISQRFDHLGRRKQARRALDEARSITEKIESIPDAGVKVPTGVEILTRIAGGYAAMGWPEESLELFEEALGWVGTLSVPEPDPAMTTSSFNSPSSVRQSRASALASIAARLERAGEHSRAEAQQTLAMVEVRKITDPDRRAEGWLALVQPYLDEARAERALEILGVGKESDPDRLMAVGAVADRLLSTDRFEGAVSILDAMTTSYSKAVLLRSLAVRFEQAERMTEAAQLVTEALSVISSIPEAARGQELVRLANEVRLSVNQATMEQQAIMNGLDCSRPSSRQ